MKKIIYILLALFPTLAVHAITQQGTVRSIARPNKASENLPNAIIRIRGSHNAVESDNNGAFSLLLQNKQNGDAIAFSTINLSGWEAAEQSFIGRQIACSDRVPIEILMVNRADLQREKDAIAEKARHNIEIYYEQRLAHLDSLLAQGQLAQADYQQRLDELELKYEQFEPLLQTMAEQYARTDIARLDSISIQINSAIENGNPDEAERLIKIKGDIDQREQQLRNDEEQLQKAQQMLDQAQASTNKRKSDLADDLFRLYSINLLRLNLDSAGYYLIRRAQLDTTNINWQLHAGRHARDIECDYPTATSYLQRAYRLAQQQYGRESVLFTTTANELGVLYRVKKDNTQAQQLFEEALNILKKIQGENSTVVAELLNNLAEIARSNNDLKTALKYHQQALDIRRKQLGEQSVEVAESLNNIGGIYYQQNNCKKALDYFKQATEIFDNTNTISNQKKATAYNNLGAVCFCLHDFDNAIAAFEKAYQLYKNEFGEQHPLTQNTLNNLNFCRNNK